MEAIEILTKRKQSMEEIAVRNEIPFNKIMEIYTRFSYRVYKDDLKKGNPFKMFNDELEERIFKLTERYFDMDRWKKLREMEKLAEKFVDNRFVRISRASKGIDALQDCGNFLLEYDRREAKLQTLQQVCEEIEKKLKKYEVFWLRAKDKGDKQAEDIFYNTYFNLKELLKKFQGGEE